MQRYNPFTMIHKALRALLYDTALRLQQTSFSDRREALETLAAVEQAVYLFGQHAHHEDAQILPAIAQFEPSVVDAFEQEHHEDEELGNKLLHLVNMFAAVNDATAREVCGSAITSTFIDFMVFNLEHMAREESVLNRILWRYYSDDELQGINQRIVASLPEEERALSARWMMRGLNREEATTWLSHIRRQAPQPVFDSLFRLAESELPSTHRQAVREAVLDLA